MSTLSGVSSRSSARSGTTTASRSPRTRSRTFCRSSEPRAGSLITALHVVRVFTGADGSEGNPLGVFLDGAEVSEGERQRVAGELGFAETVFVDDPKAGEIRIFTPKVELPFAGHPSVGTAWLLGRDRVVTALRPPAGEVAVRTEGDLTWVAARAEWAPPFDILAYESAAEIDALRGLPTGHEFAYCWAWLDADQGIVRSRCFVSELGIMEDEATGSAAIVLSTMLGREIEIHQGRGSLLSVRPLEDGWAEVGGRVVLEEERLFEL